MQSVFITGASSGIGASLARQFYREGFVVGLVARRDHELRSIKESLGERCYFYQADVADYKTVRLAAEQFMQHVGIPNVVIANAGISGGTLSEEFDDIDAFEQILRTNVLGVVNTFQPFMKGMLKENRGTFVGVSSIAGIRGLPGSGAYSASKAALTTYLESLRIELHESGVNVLTVCPGYIKTPMTDVNQFRMPFLMNSDDAADSITQAIKRKKVIHIMPWQMRLVASCMKWLPRVIYDRLASTAPRKPKFTR